MTQRAMGSMAEIFKQIEARTMKSFFAITPIETDEDRANKDEYPDDDD